MKNFLRYLLLLAASLALLSAWIVKSGRGDFPGQAGPGFDAEIDLRQLEALTQERPQVILMGDSMAEENVDLPALSQALGRTLHRMSAPGSSSALWYLSIKNNILPAPHKPQALVILFRDSTLTTPEYRVYDQVLDVMAGTDEELLLQLSYLNFMNPLEKTAREYFPFYNYRLYIQDGADYINRYLLPHFLLHCGKRCVDKAHLDIFNFRTVAAPAANDPVAQEESVLYSRRALDFQAQVGNSFLPEIIRLCRENGIRLILVRGKTISFVELPKPAGLDGYISDLGDYLQANQVAFADLEPDARLGVSDYIDRFHVIPEARGIYTQMLAEALLPFLP